MTDPKKLIEDHKIPCGPMTVSVEGVCRRRLRDHFDALLDRLTHETHPEGKDPEADDVDDEFELQEEASRKREEIERQLENDTKLLDNDIQGVLGHETLEDKKERMIEEGKMKIDAKKELQKYEEKVMGNSKMLQDTSGKIKKR